MSSQLRAKKLELYGNASQALFKPTCGMFCHWDGSCHNGTSMLVGGVVATEGYGCYLKPEARARYINIYEFAQNRVEAASVATYVSFIWPR